MASSPPNAATAASPVLRTLDWGGGGAHRVVLAGRVRGSSRAACAAVQDSGRDRPLAIIARTVKGFGVQRIVDDPGNKFHGVPLLGDAAEAAVREVLQG